MSFPKYPEYKDSGVEWLGEVPAHWEVVRVKSLFEIKKRIAGSAGHEILSITQKGIKIKDISSDEGQVSSDYSKYQLVNPGDFAMNQMDLLTGYVDISKYQGVTSPDYRVFALRDADKSCARYFLWVFKNAYHLRIFFPYGKGAAHLGRWRLPANEFNSFLVPYPSVREQEAISHFLGHETARIDALVEEQQRLIELLKEKRQSVISHAVTKGLDPDVPMKDSGVEWLGEVPAHWEVKKASYIGRLFGSDNVPEDMVSGEGDVPYLKVGSLSTDSLEVASWGWYVDPSISRSYRACDHYVVFPKRGAAIFLNKVNVVSLPALIDPNLMGWEIEGHYSTRYFAYALKLRKLDELADVSTVPQINNKHIGPERFPAPPIKEQEEIVSYLKKSLGSIDELVATSESGVKLLQERRLALISAAVTGKIDVRGWQPPAGSSAHVEAVQTEGV